MSSGHGAPIACNGVSNISEVFDLICVGFGPASLAVAVALHDLEIDARVLFLEKQSSFVWHAGMLIPSAKMQISFLKDLATFRDPTSHYTFLNYLKTQGRLESFTNLGTFLPLREEFNAYLTWAADHFRGKVWYDTEVQSVEATHIDGSFPAQEWAVNCWRMSEDRKMTLRTRRVLIAVGGSPKVPRGLSSFGRGIVHSSDYLRALSPDFPNDGRTLKFGVVGGGQSAAEIFHDLAHRYPAAQVRLFTAGSTLKPSDDSPFVNEIFDPARVEDFFALEEKHRREVIDDNRSTNYSVVRPELLDRLYEMMYSQRLREPRENKWRCQIQGSRELISTTQNANEKTDLHFVNPQNRSEKVESGFDMVFVATGYTRDAHTKILKPVEHLFERAGTLVDRDYRLRARELLVDPDAGIWLQGCCEASHGLSDSLLSILAVRGGEIVNSMFSKATKTIVAAPKLNGLTNGHTNGQQ